MMLLSHSYWPERTPPQRRWQRLVATLRDQGWQVAVVAPSANERHTPRARIPHGTFTWKEQAGPAEETIHRIPFVPLRNSRHGRFASDAISAVLMVPRALRGHSPDVVVATVPALPIICSGWLVAKLRRAAFVVDMRDAWPELAREAQIKAGPAGMMMEAVVTTLQRRAELVVSVTVGFAHRLRERGISHVECISNGVDLDDIPVLDHRPREPGELRIVYLGNHGESQALENVIVAVRQLHAQGHDGIVLRLVGSGTQKERLQELAGGSAAVEFCEAVHGPDVWSHYQWADTALISLRPDWKSFAYTVPSKTFELMSLGKHITALLTGEAATILGEIDNTTVIDVAEDPAADLQSALRDLAEDPESTPVSRLGRTWVAEYADLAVLGRRYAHVLGRVISQHSRR